MESRDIAVSLLLMDNVTLYYFSYQQELHFLLNFWKIVWLQELQLNVIVKNIDIIFYFTEFS